MTKINQKINRFERKWIIKDYDNLEVVSSLLKSDFFFNYHYPRRQVNSIYFDDLNYSSIIQNLDGISEKKKFRLRWYGNKSIIENPILEIKEKKGFETQKRSAYINNISFKDFPNDKAKLKIENIVNDKIKSNKKLYSILTTHYTRDYFISNDRKIRATVDTNLESIGLTKISDKNIIKKFKYIILEIKYETYLDEIVREKMKKISERLSRNSKLVNSVFLKPFSYS
ncbi:VTC domain-containing protein [Candidatus Pelagibacter sp.]|nr:VTC domain-containing protein [Candidatus Pelagibacter sp.]